MLGRALGGSTTLQRVVPTDIDSLLVDKLPSSSSSSRACVRPAAALRASVLCLPTDIHSLFVNTPSSSSSSSITSSSSSSFTAIVFIWLLHPCPVHVLERDTCINTVSKLESLRLFSPTRPAALSTSMTDRWIYTVPKSAVSQHCV